MEMRILELKNLTKRFGEFTAVNSISYSINKGEIFGLVGPNGAGKITTIKILTTLLPATSIVACIVKTRERFMGIGQVLTMPLSFASNAIYPIAIVPGWLKAVAHFNPLTYEVDALRAFMINGGISQYGLPFDFGELILSMVILTVIATILYPSVAR
jgi:ABC-2 type transport system permease protein